MRLFRKLTKKEWKEISEKYKDGGIHMFRGKRTLFYNGEKLWDVENREHLIYNDEERQTWQVIIILPGVEVIPDHTFQECGNVKTVIMADTVRRIETDAFSQCYSLKFVKLSTNLEYIGASAFSFCECLTSIFIPPSCREIGTWAFYECKKLIILSVPQHTQLGEGVITDTALIHRTESYHQQDDNTKEAPNLWNLPIIPAMKEPIFNENNSQILDVKASVTGQDTLPLAEIPSSKIFGNPDWIKNRHKNFPVHNLCCSEYPTFSTRTVMILRELNCSTKDECGMTPLMYLICNQTADFDLIQKMVQFGGKELLMVQDNKGWNCLHYACWVGDITIQKLIVKNGGVELADTLLHDDSIFKGRRSSDVIQSALLIHTYMNTIKSTIDHGIAETAILEKLLQSKPSYADIHDIIHKEEIHKHIPPQHLISFKEYNQALLDQELKSFHDLKEKVPLMRSTITVVGRGRDGKTCTINSLKGLPFQPYCESTKGSKTSEVNVHEIGIHVTNVEASDVSFEDAERDSSSRFRSVSSHLIKGNREREYVQTNNINSDNASTSTDGFSESNSLPVTASTDDTSESNSLLLKRRKVEQADQVLRTEEDVAKKVDDIDLATSKDGKSIRFTIYDNGGQRVFRCIQNLLLSREGIFIVVFDIMKIFDESSRAEALEHLEYWVSSIKLDACQESGSDATKDNKSVQEENNRDIDASIKYPPVILVGTHYDEFKKLKGDVATGLKTLNNILIETLPLTDLVPLGNPPGKSESNRLHLYNQQQNLCFWPVDNSNSEDENILKLRKVILDAAMNDEGFDISQEVPISMLRTMDRLTEISQKQPIIPIIDEKGNQESVMKVMSDCGVFESDKIENENICRDLLTKYHNLGHFIYFHQVQALQDFCILDPQWLMDMITYIVRDFRYHWFLRDTNAIKMNNGISWNRLKDHGILDIPLLRQLWVGTSKAHIDFLSEVLLKIGIFGKSSDYFTVPIVPTITSEAAYIESKNKMSETLEERILVGHIDMKKQRFALVPFYCRLVNALVVKDGPTPTILFSACVLRHEGNGQMFALLLDYSSSKILIVSSHSEFKEKVVVKDIRKISDKLNTIFYGDHLEFEVIAEQDRGKEPQRLQNEGEARHIYRSRVESETRMQDVDPFKKTLEENLVLCEQNKDLVNLLKQKVDTEKAKTLSKTMLSASEDVSTSTLQRWYHNDTASFMKDLLPQLGVVNIFDKNNVTAAIKELGPPLKPTNYMIACIDEKEFSTEKELIRYKLSSSKYTAQFADLSDEWEGEILIYRCCEKYDSTLLHFGAHKGTLEEANLKSVFSDQTITSQTKCCVINSCQSKEVIETVTKALSQKDIIYWDSEVDNEAAIRFSMEFYGILFANEKNSFEFKRAFEKAKFLMESHKFVFADPNKESCSAGQTIAGVLKLLPENSREENTNKKRKIDGNCSTATEIMNEEMGDTQMDNNDSSQGQSTAATDVINSEHHIQNEGQSTATAQVNSQHQIQNATQTSPTQNTLSVSDLVTTNGSVGQEQGIQRSVSHHTADDDNTSSQSGNQNGSNSTTALTTDNEGSDTGNNSTMPGGQNVSTSSNNQNETEKKIVFGEDFTKASHEANQKQIWIDKCKFIMDNLVAQNHDFNDYLPAEVSTIKAALESRTYEKIHDFNTAVQALFENLERTLKTTRHGSAEMTEEQIHGYFELKGKLAAIHLAWNWYRTEYDRFMNTSRKLVPFQYHTEAKKGGKIYCQQRYHYSFDSGCKRKNKTGYCQFLDKISPTPQNYCSLCKGIFCKEQRCQIVQEQSDTKTNSVMYAA
ncbi:hypothetical protein CTEN210_18388 [Chaetoceros tenuissimus]|uniref:Uncharacterized protein n=1 Tax=Chaetoceros tenuissimus TaxID=426638 RepID=A0AAD3DDD9_9STRA|nr:hypothetical protein CTEN210_18388 [Chaetoceros tenuissimus]